jgi:hypothetical protein
MTTTKLELENATLRDALERIDAILNANEISSIPWPTMTLQGDIVSVVHDEAESLHMLGNSDIRARDSKKPFMLNENAEERFGEAVSRFFNGTIAVALRRTRLAEISDIVLSVLHPAPEEEPEESPPLDLEAQIIRRLSLCDDAEANMHELYEQTTAECFADVEEILADLLDRKKIVRFYRVRTPFDNNDGIADYATFDDIPYDFEDDWRDPPTPFTRDQAVIDIRYKLAR